MNACVLIHWWRKFVLVWTWRFKTVHRLATLGLSQLLSKTVLVCQGCSWLNCEVGVTSFGLFVHFHVLVGLRPNFLAREATDVCPHALSLLSIENFLSLNESIFLDLLSTLQESPFLVTHTCDTLKCLFLKVLKTLLTLFF